MDPNILLAAAPREVEVAGAKVPLRADHRTGIQAMRLLDDPTVSRENKARALLLMYFGKAGSRRGPVSLPPAVQEHPGEAVDAALRFLGMNEERPPRPASGKTAAGVRTFCWDADASRVVADFQREYGVDLTDPGLSMHWWRFWSLFRGLGSESQTMEAIGVRSAVPDEKKMGKEAVDALMRRKAELLLPARTEEEALQSTYVRFYGSLKR